MGSSFSFCPWIYRSDNNQFQIRKAQLRFKQIILFAQQRIAKLEAKNKTLFAEAATKYREGKEAESRACLSAVWNNKKEIDNERKTIQRYESFCQVTKKKLRQIEDQESVQLLHSSVVMSEKEYESAMKKTSDETKSLMKTSQRMSNMDSSLDMAVESISDNLQEAEVEHEASDETDAERTFLAEAMAEIAREQQGHVVALLPSVPKKIPGEVEAEVSKVES